MPKPKPKANKKGTQTNKEHKQKTEVLNKNSNRLPRVVIDTSVWISAKISISNTSNPYKVYEKWQKGYFTIIIDNSLLTELIEKLEEKTKLTEEAISNFIEEIINSDTIFLEENWTTESFTEIDPGDNILAVATYQGNADYLVTSDKRVLNKKYFKGTKIISINDFLNLEELNRVKNIESQTIEMHTKFKAKIN